VKLKNAPPHTNFSDLGNNLNAVTVVQIDKTTRAFFQDTKATPRRKMSAGNDNQQRMFRLYKNGIKVSKPKNEKKKKGDQWQR
jgi:hypothetical protein